MSCLRIAVGIPAAVKRAMAHAGMEHCGAWHAMMNMRGCLCSMGMRFISSTKGTVESMMSSTDGPSIRRQSRQQSQIPLEIDMRSRVLHLVWSLVQGFTGTGRVVRCTAA